MCASTESNRIVGQSSTHSFESRFSMLAGWGRACRVMDRWSSSLACTLQRRAAPKLESAWWTFSIIFRTSVEASVSSSFLKAVMNCLAKRSLKSCHLLVVEFSLMSIISGSMLTRNQKGWRSSRVKTSAPLKSMSRLGPLVAHRKDSTTRPVALMCKSSETWTLSGLSGRV